MKTFIDVTFNSEGKAPALVVKLLSDLGFTPIGGEHDFIFEWKTEDEYRETIKKVHIVLKGSNVSYRIKTLEDREEYKEMVWFAKVR